MSWGAWGGLCGLHRAKSCRCRAWAVTGDGMGFNAAAGAASYVQVAYGEVTVATTGENLPLLTGTLCSIAVSAIVCITVGHATPSCCHVSLGQRKARTVRGCDPANNTCF